MGLFAALCADQSLNRCNMYAIKFIGQRRIATEFKFLFLLGCQNHHHLTPFHLGELLHNAMLV